MIKNTAFIAICVLFLNESVAQILPVKLVTQEQNQWCWAGSSKCILDYYNYPIPQCDIAEYTRTVASWHDFGTVNCCTSPTGSCNYWNYNWGYTGSIQDILKHFHNIQNYGKGTALTLAETQTEIDNWRPFIIRWGWTAGGGHFIIGHGIQNGTLYYMNPWYGEGLKFATYDWVKSNAYHTWTHTNVITTNPTILLASTKVLTIAAPANSTNTFTISSNIGWNVASDQSWLTTSDVTGSGNKTITLTASANSTATNRVATITISGTGVDAQTIAVTQDIGTTLVKEVDDIAVSVFPNPSNTTLFIRNSGSNAFISVFDVYGKLLLNKPIVNNQVDISNLPSGVYTLKINMGNRIITKKIVKN